MTEATFLRKVPSLKVTARSAKHRHEQLNNYTEHAWVVVSIGGAIKDLMKTYVQYPPRKQPSASYSGPITLQQYERFQFMRDALAKEGINIPLPTGN